METDHLLISETLSVCVGSCVTNVFSLKKENFVFSTFSQLRARFQKRLLELNMKFSSQDISFHVFTILMFSLWYPSEN